MSQHLHSEFVPGCYRCELSRDETVAAFADWDARDARQAEEDRMTAAPTGPDPRTDAAVER